MMNKSIKIFAKIVYYVFTFSLGILLAYVLPGIIMTANVPGHIEGYLNNGEYSRAMNLLVAFDDKEIAYQEEFSDGSGIVLFRTLIDVEETNENKTVTKVYYSYSGFLYGTRNNYKTNKLLNNKTKVIVNNGSEDINITILNYDTDEDGLFDDIVSKENYDYVCFDIRKDKASQIKSVAFMDCDGNIYQKTKSIDLDFNNLFFNSLDNYVNEINGDNPTKEKALELEKNFLAISSNYEKASYTEEKRMANRDGIVIVLIYFISVYVIADFLVGRHYIIRFFVWLSRKIRHIEVEEKKTDVGTKDVYGTDYYTMVTFKFNVPEDCDINITVNYHNETDEIEMVFSKDKDYTVQQRVHAGTYVNAWLECPGYVSVNLPTTLEIRGYTMSVDVTLRKETEETDIKQQN